MAQTATKQKKSNTKQKPATVKDARENIKLKPAIFRKIVFSDSGEGPSKLTPLILTTTTSAQTTTEPVNAIIKKDLLIETRETYKYYVSRVDPNITIQEETQPNVESPTMSTTQLEASHEIIVCEIVAKIYRETNTEEEDVVGDVQEKPPESIGCELYRRCNPKRQKREATRQFCD